MRLRLSTKIAALIVAMVAASAVSSVLAMLSVWQITGEEERLVHEILPAIHAAEDLEIALLDQKGLTASFMVEGGDRRWLHELRTKKGDFDEALAQVRRSALTAEGEAILPKIEAAYRGYCEERDRTVGLYEAGEAEKARAWRRDHLIPRFYETHALCRDLREASRRHAEAGEANVHRVMRRAAWTLGLAAGTAILLGGLLLWLFFFRILLPLRRMVADAASQAGEGSGGAVGPGRDEPAAVGLYLRTLMSDVTDARSALDESHRRLQSAEKLAAVGKLAAGVAHEIRNPLTAVRMWLFSIQQSVGRDEQLGRKLAIVFQEITRLEDIIHSFLEFSRPPAMKLGSHDVGALVANTLDLFSQRAQQSGVRLLGPASNGLPPVLADAKQLKQVLVNLLSNAADATPRGGEIRVTASCEPDPKGRRMVVLRVCDTGPGMPEEVRQRIFEPFHSTKDSGTGLGLCIAAAIMARHDGRLVLESAAPGGTSFAVWIPAAWEGPETTP